VRGVSRLEAARSWGKRVIYRRNAKCCDTPLRPNVDEFEGCLVLTAWQRTFSLEADSWRAVEREMNLYHHSPYSQSIYFEIDRRKLSAP